MKHRVLQLPIIGIAVLAACVDSPGPTAPPISDASTAIAPGQSQLATWFEHASPAALAVAGAVFADHDEDNNRLVFGVEHAAAARGIATALTRLGIPQSSYAIVTAAPIYQLATLRDVFRPTIAGVQLHFGQYVCSLGFNADDGTARSLVTASHCTNRQGGVEGTQYYQPLSSTAPAVAATEVEDPDYFRGAGCPKGKKCRRSDAARALYSASVASTRGAIAQTSGPNNTSLTVTGSFTITTQNNTSTTWSNGTVMNKVGRSSGWTQGTVSGTCVNTAVSGTNIVQLCQTFVSRLSGESDPIVIGGDSGSGVFRITSGNNVELTGILWGGDGVGSLFVFSPLKQVRDELGPLVATN